MYGAFGLFYVDIRLENSTAGCRNYKYGGNLQRFEVMLRMLMKIQVFCTQMKESERGARTA